MQRHAPGRAAATGADRDPVTAARRPVSEADRRTFARDGVVCLRSILDSSWIERMRVATERVLRSTADMSAIAETRGRPTADAPGTGRFRAGIDHWRVDEDFAAFATASPLPAVVAALLDSSALVLYEDSLLVKEPGTAEETRWHQDLGYFHVEGEQIATTWCPLDDVDAASGAIRYVRGSHRWGRVFRPNLFVVDEPIPGTEGETVPDVEATVAPQDILVLEMSPGDVAVHHAATLHSAGPNRDPDRSRRAISVRYCGDDARVRLRPGAPRKAEQAAWVGGARLADVAAPGFAVLPRRSEG